MKNNSENIISKGDYSIELLKEIASDVNKISTYTNNIRGKLEQISAKLSRAQEIGLNIEVYEKKFFTFRKVNFLRSIKFYINNLNHKGNNFGINLLYEIDIEYKSLIKELKKSESIKVYEKFDYLDEIQNNYIYLKNEIKINKLKKKILDIKDPNSSLSFDLKEITEELLKFKKEGIDITELENLIYE